MASNQYTSIPTVRNADSMQWTRIPINSTKVAVKSEIGLRAVATARSAPYPNVRICTTLAIAVIWEVQQSFTNADID